jgi:hypothetical protein
MTTEEASLASRVRCMVSRYYAGNVARAALAADVPQRTMARIVSGTTSDPSATLIMNLSDHFRGSFEWFLTGKGAEPLGPASFVANGGSAAATFGNRLKEALRARGISQRQFQRDIAGAVRGTTYPALHRVLTGDVCPRLDLCEVAADLLRVRRAWLMAAEGEME